MRGMRCRLLRRLAPFVLIAGLLFPSCGFIGLLFDGGDEGDNSRYFNVQMSYNYSGGKMVSENSRLVMLFIPLDENYQFTDEGFSKATYKANLISSGVVTVQGLEKGPYAVLGFIDDLPSGLPDGQLNMNEVYAFFNKKDFVSSVPQPDYIMVDSSLETWTPHFELDDSFFMDGFIVLSPAPGETVYGEEPGTIYMVGLKFEERISKIVILIDDVPQAPWPADQEIFSINMSTKSTGLHSLGIIPRDVNDNFVSFDMPPLNVPFDFYYVAP